MNALSSLGIVVLLTLTGCPKNQSSTGPNRDLSQFECNDRKAEYTITGGFGSEEAGVGIYCDDDDPRVVKWSVDSGDRDEHSNPLTAEQFDAVWEKVDSTGWRHMEEECDNPDAAPDDPKYVLHIADHASDRSLNCDGKTLSFPYDRIVNELDLRAAGFGDQDASNR